MIRPATRISQFRYAIRDIVAAAEALEREGREVIHLNIGDPQVFGYRPPDEVVDRLVSAQRFLFTGYAHSAGIPEARQAIAKHATTLGSPTEPNDVIVTAGASEAADLVLTALLDPKDEVLIPAPGYPLYSAIINKLGAEPRPYFLDAENGWQPNAAAVASKITVRTRAIVLINPNNPTGSVTGDDTTREILEIAAENELLVISDEVYRELCFGEAPTAASVLAKELSVPVITLDSLSKTHMLTGSRVGWMRFSNTELMPELIAAITRLASGRLCSPTPAQYAVKPALAMHCGHGKSFLRSIRAKRDSAVETINKIPGLSCEPPDAAFYLMVRVNETFFADDREFVVAMLKNTGVLVVPGSGLGCTDSDRYFRMVYLADTVTLRRALNAIGAFMSTFVGNCSLVGEPEMVN